MPKGIGYGKRSGKSPMAREAEKDSMQLLGQGAAKRAAQKKMTRQQRLQEALGKAQRARKGN